MSSPILCLMYHELELPGRDLCDSQSGYRRYVLTEGDFRGQMEYLRSVSYGGVSVGQALTLPTVPNAGAKISPAVAITFDDASETDLLAAAPILSRMGFGATFYITAGWIGKRGHLSRDQLKELGGQGFEIGSHSMTHARLTELDEPGLKHEIVESKSYLEQILGKPVDHFSCPGGRYNAVVASVARAAGYRSVATSRVHTNSSTTNAFALGRIAILRNTSIDGFAAICSGKALPRLRAEGALRDAARRLMGDSFYDRLRTLLLGGRSTP